MVLGRSFSYSGLLIDSVNSLAILKRCFMALLCAGSFYYGHHTERQKRQRSFLTTMRFSWPLLQRLSWPRGICFLGAFKMPFPHRVGIAAERFTWNQQPVPCRVHRHLRLQRPAFANPVTPTGPPQTASVASVLVSRRDCIGQNNMSPWAISSNTAILQAVFKPKEFSNAPLRKRPKFL